MAENTKIEWAHHTFNPWIGCTKVGPGCDHCYAEADFDKRRHVVQWGAGQPRKHTASSTWHLPVKWNAEAERLGVRYRVFCASLADVFDNEVDREWRDDLATLILNTPHLDWLLVTKRIGNAGRMLGEMFMDGTPDNVWLGATITSQDEADRDIPKLVEVPARVRFLSMEPLLGPVDIRKWLDPYTCADCGFHGCDDDSGPCGCSRCGESDAFSDGRDECKSCGADDQSANRSCPSCGSHHSYERDMGFIWSSEQRLIDWVIVGGESGSNARPMHPNWARSLRDQCASAEVAFFMKQLSGDRGKVINEMSMLPEDLRIMEYPNSDGKDA